MSKPLMTQLRDATQEFHSKLEILPFFKELTAHSLPLDSYVNQLRALAVIHASLEEAVAASDDTMVQSVWDERQRKLPMLEADLAFFKPRVVYDATIPVEYAVHLANKIRLSTLEAPVNLLGILYVFEGTTLGNNMHHPDVLATFHLAELSGSRFYASYQEDVPARWKEFSEKMNSAVTDPALHEQIVKAAVEMFIDLEELYKGLFPLDKEQMSFHVSRINVEAGNHPIPQDEDEIAAALRASTRGWDAFPYYQERYGDRGKRFSDSDSCWLASLAEHDQTVINEQITWIAQVLAARGMPSLMLDETLRFLHDELVHALPANAGKYDGLLQAAEALAADRTRHISGNEEARIAAAFEQAAGAELSGKFMNTGRLLVCAVADERCGRIGSVESLRAWLTDADRFPEQWIAAVDAALDQANAVSQ